MTTTDPSTPTATRRTTGPSRWKMWLLLTAAIYPLILLIATLTHPLVGSLPPAVRFLVIVPIMTGTVVWLVLPQIHRRFGRWLAR